MEHLIHDIFVLYALEDIPGYPHGTWVLVLRNGLAEDFNYFLGRYGAAATHTHDYCTIRSVQATERTKRNTINLFADGRLTVRSFKDGAYQDEEYRLTADASDAFRDYILHLVPHRNAPDYIYMNELTPFIFEYDTSNNESNYNEFGSAKESF